MDNVWGWKNDRLIPVHQIAASLGVDKSRSLPVFHAFTGCETVSSFGAEVKNLLGMSGLRILL